MSGKSKSADARLDPRTRRTSDALRETLVKLVRNRCYDQIRIADVVRGSGVGRSTFYDHYKGLDDMIVETMADMLEALSTVVDEEPALVHIAHILEHFRENRTFARHLLSAPSTAQVARRIVDGLGERIACRLERRASRVDARPLIDTRLAARYVAAGQMEIIRTSLSGESFDATGLARALVASGKASADALLDADAARR
jgi:AcrR family transcriptional regulator